MNRTHLRDSEAKCAKVGARAIDCVRFNEGSDTQDGGDAEHHGVEQFGAARAAAFDAFAKLALAYFENPSTELRAACEAAAFVVRTMRKVGQMSLRLHLERPHVAHRVAWFAARPTMSGLVAAPLEVLLASFQRPNPL